MFFFVLPPGTPSTSWRSRSVAVHLAIEEPTHRAAVEGMKLVPFY